MANASVNSALLGPKGDSESLQNPGDMLARFVNSVRSCKNCLWQDKRLGLDDQLNALLV